MYVHKPEIQKGATLLAGCKGSALRRTERKEGNYPVDDFRPLRFGSRLRCAEGETLAGGSKGAAPLWQV